MRNLKNLKIGKNKTIIKLKKQAKRKDVLFLLYADDKVNAMIIKGLIN
jgi:hypothetical protein